MGKGKTPATYPSWEILSGNVTFDVTREERFGSMGGGRSFRWSTISGNLRPREGSDDAEELGAKGFAWEVVSGNMKPIDAVRMQRYESSAPGYVWNSWGQISGNLEPLDSGSDAQSGARGVLHDLDWGTGQKMQKHHSRGMSWEDLRSMKDRVESESAGWESRSTSRSKSGGSPKRKRLSLTGALMTEFLDSGDADGLGLMGKISEGARSEKSPEQQQQQKEQQARAAAASRLQSKPPKPSHPRLSAELRAAATKVHSGYLHKEGGGTSFFGSKAWKKR